MKLKKYLSILTAAAFMAAGASGTAAAGDIQVVVNSVRVVFDAEPFISSDRILVPIRAVTEAMDFDVEWDGISRSAVISNDSRTVTVSIGSPSLNIEEKGRLPITVSIDVPAVIRDNRTFLPLRAIAEAFDAEVSWDGETMTASIDYEPPGKTVFAGLQINELLKNLESGLQEDILRGESYGAYVQEPSADAEEDAREYDADYAKDAELTDGARSSELEEYAAETVRLANAERQKAGVAPLTADPLLTRTAQEHSEDMAANDFFSHENLRGESPFDRLKRNGVKYMSAAENVACGQPTPQSVIEAWMRSDGHRENMLSPSYSKIGVGVAANSSGTLYWTQNFTD